MFLKCLFRFTLCTFLAFATTSCRDDVVILDPEPKDFPSEGRIVKIIAHRGFWNTNGSCQNSLASIVKAAEIGADGVECDVRVTADGVLVVNHDPEYDGKTISSTKYEDLNKTPLPNGEDLPTFKNYLRTIKEYPSLILFIEIKESKVLEQLNDILIEEKVNNPIVYISFYKSVCDKLIKSDSRFRVQLLRSSGEFFYASQLLKEGYYGIAYSYSLYNQHLDTVFDASYCGAVLMAWTLTENSQYDWLFDHGFRFAITDNPKSLIELSYSNQKYWYKNE